MRNVKDVKKEEVSRYVIKSITYSQPKLVVMNNGENLVGRNMVLYAVGVKCQILGIGYRKVTEIIYSKEIDGFEIHFDETDAKIFTRKGLLTIPRLSDTEVYYEREEN